MKDYGLQWDTIGSLPFVASLHAYYVNGRYATSPIMYRKGAVWIDVVGDAPHAARWLDVENEDAKPEIVPTWLDQRAAHGEGGIYCNRATLPAVIEHAAGRKFDLWLATLDGNVYPYQVNALPDNVTLCAVQAFPSSMLKINADLSVVWNQKYWETYATP